MTRITRSASAGPFRRRVALVAAALAAVALGTVVAVPATRAAGPVDITLLNINDFHGRIDNSNPASPSGNLTLRFAATIDALRAAAPGGEANTLLLGAGDLMGASLFNSAVAAEQPTIDVMNALGLNASSVGNHEFDRGFADLRDRVINNKTNATWDYLAANVYDSTGTPALPAYATYQVAGVTVGVIGVVTQETPTLVSPGGIVGLTFGDPVEAINRVAAQLSDGDPQNGEAQVLVAEIHEGAEVGSAGGSTLAAEVAKGGVFAHIVNDTGALVDAIFTGHTHQDYAWDGPVPGQPGKTRPILQTGNYGDRVGKVVLTVDSATGDVASYTVANVARQTVEPPTPLTPRLAQVKSIVDAAVAAAAVVGSVPKGSVTADVTTAFSGGSYTGPGSTYVGGTRDDRSKESALGDLVAKALRDTLASPARGGAQIGVVNPGGLRAELNYAQSGTEGNGVVTYAEANSVLPFVNNLWTTTLTGAQFKTLLEQQWQRDAAGNVPSRPYLQLGLSSNVTYTFDATLPEGSRITSVTVDGAPLDAAGSYRIGTFSFLALGGDNFRILTRGANTRDSGLVDRDGWIDYLVAHPGIVPDFARQAVSVSKLPTSVTLGSRVIFGLSGLDLTSLGSPRNTSATVTLGGRVIGTVGVLNGAAAVDLTVTFDAPSGLQNLVVAASPTGTTVTIQVSVSPGALRLADTRSGLGLPGPLAPGVEARLQIAGANGVPVGASSVVLNITTVNAPALGYVSAYPCNAPPNPPTSNLNQAPDHIVANEAVVQLDPSGAICVRSNTATDLVVDLQAWNPAATDFHAATPVRLADSREGRGIAAHLTPGTVVALPVAGANGVAANASTVVVNLTAVESGFGYVTAYPCGALPPLASDLNTWPGHAIANVSFTAVGANGSICFTSNTTTDLIVDLQGWYPAGGSYTGFTPVRALDTRETAGPITPGNVRPLKITGGFGVPAAATVVSVNLTAVDAQGEAFVAAYACGQPTPLISNNNTSPDRIVATHALVPIGPDGSICFAANHTTDLVVDVQGWRANP